MMKLADECAITTEELACALQSSDNDQLQILMIDCRSFMEFNSCHIMEAHNIHCPPIVKRRSGGILPLSNIVRCPQTQGRLLGGAFDMIVVYDENNVHAHSDSLDSNLGLVLRTLRDEIKISNVYYLLGGFHSFRLACPDRCLSVQCFTDQSSSSPMSKKPCSLTIPSKLAIPSAQDSSCLTQDRCLGCNALRGTPCCNCSVLRENNLCPQQQRFKFDQGDPVQVLSWLYVGSAFHACQRARLRALGVTALLNVSLSDFPQMADFLYKNIPVDDNATTEIGTWFPEAIDFIEDVRLRGGCVLVHCHAGISRSATICLAYLMYHKGFSLNQAFDFLKDRRSVISPNFNFMRQLQEYEMDLMHHRDHENLFDASQTQGAPLKLTLSPLTPVGPHQQSGVFLFDTPPIVTLSAPPISPLVSPS